MKIIFHILSEIASLITLLQLFFHYTTSYKILQVFRFEWASFPHQPWFSFASRNEPGNAGLNNCIKPDPQLDSLGDLPHGFFRNGRELTILIDAHGSLRGCQ